MVRWIFVPNLEFEVPRAGTLERARSWIRFVPALAEVIGVDSNPRAVRLIKRRVRNDSPAKQPGRYEFARPRRVPGRVIFHFEIKTVGFPGQFEGRIKFGLDERIGFMPGRPGTVQENIAVHPYEQPGAVEGAQTTMAHKQVVVEAVIAGRVVVISRHPGGVRLEKGRLAAVEGRQLDGTGEQVVGISAALRMVH